MVKQRNKSKLAPSMSMKSKSMMFKKLFPKKMPLTASSYSEKGKKFSKQSAANNS